MNDEIHNIIGLDLDSFGLDKTYFPVYIIFTNGNGEFQFRIMPKMIMALSLIEKSQRDRIIETMSTNFKKSLARLSQGEANARDN